MNLTELSKAVHEANIKWWQDPATGLPIKRNRGELLALVHSEISEAYEGESRWLMDDKLPHRLMGEVELVDAAIRILDYARGFYHDIGAAARKVGIGEFIDLNHFHKCCHRIGGFGLLTIHSKVSIVLELERKSKPSSEVADALVECLVHIFTYARACCYDMQGAFDEKMAFNAQREDHKHEARLIAGGKQF